MNGDAQEVLLRRRLGELAGFARTTPRMLPSASALRTRPAMRQPPTPWRAALLVGFAAAVIGGMVVLSQRERPIVPTNSTGSATAPEQSTANTAPGSVPSPSTTYVAVDPGPILDPAGVITYATTDQRNTTWPTVATSGTPASNRGYGMAVCDSSSWTKFASLESDNGPRHTYVGTLCTITTLAEPAPGTVATCAAVTPDVHYARCQRLDDTAAGTAAPHPETPDTMIIKSDSAPLGLRVTPSDAKPIFGTDVPAGSPGSAPFSDATVSVQLSAGETSLTTCFEITFAAFSSAGCVDTTLLSTGLAYAAFQDRTGPIELVGIVPDDVATVEIAGVIIPVRTNVWHFTAPAGADLNFTVRSADQTLSAALG